jgi:TetR/AcrR family transcriptional regulator, repressor for uid operon
MFILFMMSQRTDQRRAEILQAAATCFIRRGFHQTSMKELCAEAQLSPGLLYHYFTSKDEIIVAIAEEAHKATQGLLEELHQVPTLREALTLLIERLVTWLGEEGEARLYLETSVEASRNTRVRGVLSTSDTEFIRALQALFDAAVHRGELTQHAETESLAILVGVFLDGVILNTALLGTPPLSTPTLTQSLSSLIELT